MVELSGSYFISKVTVPDPRTRSIFCFVENKPRFVLISKGFENFLTCEDQDFFILVGENRYSSPKELAKYTCGAPLVFQEN